MSKWHVGPNGPGICNAKKRPCPFGGAENHYDTQSEAEEVYKKSQIIEFGVLPDSVDKSNWPIDVLCYNDRNVPLATSNFVLRLGKGSAANTKYLEDKLKDANMEAEEMVKSLNEDRNISGQWSIKEDSEDFIKLEKVDIFHGHSQFINIRRHEPKEIAPDRDEIVSFNNNGQRTSLANYVSNGPGGYPESIRYMENIIKGANLDSKKLVDVLNNDDRILGQWSLEDDNDEYIKLEHKDIKGNLDYLKISKY